MREFLARLQPEQYFQLPLFKRPSPLTRARSTPMTAITADDLKRWNNDDNLAALARVMMSETSIRSEAEASAVAWCVLDRLKRNGEDKVRSVWRAFAHNQEPSEAANGLAAKILGSEVASTHEVTHFYSPQAMPHEGQPTTGMDVAGGLEQVDGLPFKTYRPGWARTFREVHVEGVEPRRFKFYAAPGEGPVDRGAALSAVRSLTHTPGTATLTVENLLAKDKRFGLEDAASSAILNPGDPEDDFSLPGNAKLGGGYNSFRGVGAGLQGIPVKRYKRKLKPAQGYRAVYEIQRIQSYSQLREELKLNASASYSGLFASGSASARWYQSTYVSRFSVLLLARVRIDLGTVELNDYELNDEAVEYLTQKPPLLARFYERFGDLFVSGYAIGGELNMLFEFSAHTEAQLRELTARVEGSCGTFRAAAEFSRNVSAFSSGSQYRLWIDRTGGRQAAPEPSVEALVSWLKEFEQDVVAHPAAMRVFTREFVVCKGYPARLGDVFASSRQAYASLAALNDRLRLCSSDLGYASASSPQFTLVRSATLELLRDIEIQLLSLAKRLAAEPYVDQSVDIKALDSGLRDLEAQMPRYAEIHFDAPIGSPDEDAFNDGEDGVVQGSRDISQVFISYGAVVDGFQVFYRRPGAPDYSPGYHGGRGGNADTISLAPGEYLVAVWGLWGPTPGYGSHVYEVRFRTSSGRAFGPYGNAQGIEDRPFSFAPPSARIFALSGRVGRYINAIGIAHSNI